MQEISSFRNSPMYGNVPNSLGEERASYNNAFQVDSEVNPSGAWNPSDDWIKKHYGF